MPRSWLWRGFVVAFVLVRLVIRLDHARGDHVVELVELGFEILVAARLNELLAWSPALRRAFAILLVERIDHVHSFHDGADRREAALVEKGVVLEVDEHLRG